MIADIVNSFILLFIITACGSGSPEVVTITPAPTAERLTIDGAGDLRELIKVASVLLEELEKYHEEED